MAQLVPIADQVIEVDLSIDPLQITHAIFNAKTERYKKIRVNYKFASTRLKRRLLISSAFEYEEYLEKVFNQLCMTSKAAGKPGGRFVLMHIRDALERHAHDVRNDGETKNKFNVFRDFVYHEDMHPDSNLTRYLHAQRRHQQTFASDFESQIIIRYMEDKMVSAQQILADDVLGHDHPLYQLHPEAEKALNTLRIAYCA